MQVRFWGTRGSIPTPGPATARYGGNTSCVEVRTAAGTVLVLDCGTGARALGLSLAHQEVDPLRLHLLIGHTHWDHIQGFPFFLPAFLPSAELNIHAPVGFRRGLEEALGGQMEYGYFPVKLRDLRSRIHFTELDEGFLRIGDVLVETQYLNHTAPTIAYRISADGATIAYVTDHEPFDGEGRGVSRHPGDQRHLNFLRGADLVIHDAQYTEEEYRTKRAWGHSTIEYATDVALAAGVRRLALFHHDPQHDDAMLDRLQAEARERAGRGLELFAAAEGMVLDMVGAGGAQRVTEVSALDRRPVAGARILVATPNADDLAAIREVLAEDEMVLLGVPEMSVALERAGEFGPDLAIVDESLAGGDVRALLKAIRSRTRRPNLPVLLLAHDVEAAGAVQPPDADADVYLARPFSAPMLHARVRAWLARVLTGERRSPPEPVRLAAPVPRRLATPRPARPMPPVTPVLRTSAVLASMALFESAAPDTLEALAEKATERAWEPGQTLVTQGEQGSDIFVVLSGRARVIGAMSDGQTEAVLGELGAGEVIGELAMLTGRPRSATVIAIERTRCLAIPQAHFLEVMARSPELAVGVSRLLARRLVDADRRLARYAPDGLTGLASRRALHDLYRRLGAGARRRKSGVATLLLDVIGLGAINDRFGYLVGDEVLRVTADSLMDATRATDLVARVGADEFAVLLLEATPGDGERVLARIAERLVDLSSRRALRPSPRCRVGLAYHEVAPESLDLLLREADLDMRRTVREIPA